MGIHTNVFAALNTRLASLAGAPPIVYQNKDYNPSLGTTYLQASFIPTTGAYDTLLGGRTLSGIYQIDIRVAKDKGIATLTNWMDAVDGHFSGNLTLTAGSTKVRVGPVTPGILLEEDGWCRGIIQINYSTNF